MRRLIAFFTGILTFVSGWSQTSDTLTIQGSVGNMYAILQRPSMKNVQKVPLVIICHGFSGNCRTPLMRELADDIVAQGMAALRFDFNGHGKSDGLFQNMTVPNEIDDLKSVIAWARIQPWVGSIGLVGHSQGGVVVSMTSGMLGSLVIKAEVLMAPAAVLRDDALRGNTMGATYDPWNLKSDYVELPHSPEAGPLRLGKAYIETAKDLPIYKTAALYRGPALILQGTHDRIVPYTYAEHYEEVLKKGRLELIEGENHGFTLTQSSSAKMVADWLKKQLN
ncbi:MAG: lysophospholipase [Bacteroides sp.]|nr:lysophospholipase [Bacteroides sp.]